MAHADRINRYRKSSGITMFTAELKPEYTEKLEEILNQKGFKKAEYLRYCIDRDFQEIK